MSTISTVSQEVQQTSARMRRLRQEVDLSDDPTWLKSILDQCDVARAWSKTRDEIDALLREILYLEIRALRRISALGTEGLRPRQRTLANWVTSDAYSDRLVEEFLSTRPKTVTVGGLKAYYDKQQRDEFERRYAVDSARKAVEGGPGGARPFMDHLDYRMIQSAEWAINEQIERLLNQASTDPEKPTSVQEVYEGLRDTTLLRGLSDDPALVEGVKEVIRGHFRAHSERPRKIYGQKNWWDDAPEWVTVPTDAGHFVRVAFPYARIGDFDAFIEFRESQVSALSQAVERLKKIRDRWPEAGPDDRIWDLVKARETIKPDEIWDLPGQESA